MSVKAILIFSSLLSCVPAWTDKPAFCQDYECPQYTLLEQTKTYEVREYAPSVWLTTRYNASSWWSKLQQTPAAFHKLIKYFYADNVQGKMLEMTVPVRTYKMKPREQEMSYTHEMAFYLPASEWSSPPESRDPSIVIRSVPAQRYYVRKFGGYVFESTFDDEVANLKEDLLLSNAKDHRDTHFVIAGYNSPTDLFNRHNEVMLELDLHN